MRCGPRAWSMRTPNRLQVERVSQDSTVRVSLPATLNKGQSDTLIFEYEGAIQSADDSPVQGLKLAYVGDPITYLLYAGRWFPMVGYGTNRFTSTISVSCARGIHGDRQRQAERRRPAGD